MDHSWDIIVWTLENSIDYVPSSWANNTRTKYKYPLTKNSLKIRRLVDNNMILEDDQFEWLDAICKAQSIQDLPMAKELCERGTYTSNLEVTDQESSAGVKKKRRRIIKRQMFGDEDSSSDDDNKPLARGQNLIRKVFSSHKTLNSQEASSTDNAHKKNNVCCANSEPENTSHCETPTSASTFNNATSSSQQTPKSISTLVPSRDHVTFSNEIKNSNSSIVGLRKSTHSTSDLAPLLEEITEIKFTMREMKDTLSRIERFINVNSGNRNIYGDDDTYTQSKNHFLEKLPCQTKQQLEEVDSIINEPKCMKELVNFLYLAGGSNPHKSIYMAMQKLFEKEIALLYSGQGKKKKISFCSTKTYQAVFAAIRKRYPTVSDDSIMKSVSLFLATAKSRLTGKRNSATPASDNEGEVDLPDAEVYYNFISCNNV